MILGVKRYQTDDFKRLILLKGISRVNLIPQYSCFRKLEGMTLLFIGVIQGGNIEIELHHQHVSLFISHYMTRKTKEWVPKTLENNTKFCMTRYC